VICYFLKDYECAYEYFNSMYEMTRALGLDRYHGEKGKMGLILSKLGRPAESEIYLKEYLEFAENDQGIYRGLSLAAYYSNMGDSEKALEYMGQFSQQEKYPYWYILFMGLDDPLFESVNDLPEFQNILREIELKFWRYHKQIKDSLKEKGLL